MNAERSGALRRWVASFLAAIVAGVVLLSLFRIPQAPPSNPLPSSSSRPAPLALETRRDGQKEEIEMRDQRPLFLPTDRNAAPRPLPRRQGVSLLDQEAVKFFFTESGLSPGLPPPVVVPKDVAEAVLANAPPAPLRGFGRDVGGVAPWPSRGAAIEVFSSRDNRRVLFAELPASNRPPTDVAWRPMEFMAVVKPLGLVGSLVVTERSGVEMVETYFANFLAKTYRLGDRLLPGSYRVVVAP